MTKSVDTKPVQSGAQAQAQKPGHAAVQREQMQQTGGSVQAGDNTGTRLTDWASI